MNTAVPARAGGPGTPVAAAASIVALPLVVVVVLNWNGADDTLDCLRSLAALRYGRFEVIVVDNGSVDDSVPRLRAHSAPYPLSLIETGANLGFAEGNNVGIRDALRRGADFVLLLNNDTVVDPGMLDAFVQSAAEHPRCAVASGKIYFFDEPKRLWYAGATWREEGLHFQHDGLGEFDDERFAHARPTDYASGCALFLRAATLAHVGLLDADFFLTYEESDLCYRARALGYEVLFEPHAQLWHKVSRSFGGVESPLQLYFYNRNVLLWAERHLDRRTYWALVRQVLRNTFRLNLGTSSQPLWRRLWWMLGSARRRLAAGSTDPVARARWLGLRDYVLRRFGDCPSEVRDLNRAARRPAVAV